MADKKFIKDIEIITNFIDKNKDRMTSEETKTFRELAELLPKAMDIVEE